MSDNKKYVAYVGTYTHENSVGIHVYDIDTKEGVLTERSVAPINNPSDLCISKDGKMVYSIEDEGVAAFTIDQKTGDLTKVNQAWIGGMRGCSVDVDSARRYLFVGGFHDGRVTMMRLNPDGSMGDIADGIFHQGLAISSARKRLDHPKVSCVRLTPDEKYLCAADHGLNQVKVYRVDYKRGKLHLVDIIRCALDSGPRALHFSPDGAFLYILDELTCEIEIYRYKDFEDEPEFDLIDTVSVLDKASNADGASDFCMSENGKQVFVSIDGFNGCSCLDRDEKSGMLTLLSSEPTSGYFPKSLSTLPDGDFVAVLNHDNSEIRTFRSMEGGRYALMKNAPVKVDKPNCIRIFRLA
ncbi:MAG: beta-propeller fold lactonase family protein [Lachnospiraceae bacterium]|nr:beta-propeller fold lactonase family protein [Lachnospiraceae bacterium]